MSAPEPGIEAPLSDSLILRFILGELADEERERVESQVFSSDLAFARVLMEEDSLCADYARDVMDGATRARFEQRLPVAPHLQERLAFHRALARVAAASLAAPPASRAAPAGERASHAAPAPRRMARRTIATLVAVAAAIALAAYLGLGRERSAPAVARLALLPSETRGVAAAPRRATIGPGAVLSLDLVLTTSERFARYRVVARRNAKVVWSSVVDSSSAAEAVAVNVPAGALASGRYVLELSGIDADGREEAVASYEVNVAP